MLAKALGAELVLPHASHRTSFDESRSFYTAPAASLLDVEAITEYWNHNGMFIHSVIGQSPVLWGVQCTCKPCPHIKTSLTTTKCSIP